MSIPPQTARYDTRSAPFGVCLAQEVFGSAIPPVGLDRGTFPNTPMTAVIGAKPGKGHAGTGTRLFHSLVSYLVLAVTYLFVRPYQNRHAQEQNCQAVDMPPYGNQARPTVSCLHRRTRTVKQWTRVAETNQRPESKRCPKLRVVKQWTRVAETSAKQTIVQNKRFVRAVPRAVPNLQIQPPKIPQHRKSSAKRQEVEVNAKPSGRRKAVRTRAQAKGRARAGQPARMLYRVWPAAWEPILHSHCCSVWD